MQERFSARLKAICVIFFAYFLPWVFVSFYTDELLAPEDRWPFLPLTLLFSLLGTLLLALLLHRFESDLEAFFTNHPSLEDSALDNKIPAQESETPSLEAPYVLLYEEVLEQLQKEQSLCKEVKEQCELQKKQQVELEQQHQAEMDALRLQLLEERKLTEHRQQQIHYLEHRAHELKYEIKTLMDIADRLPDSKSASSEPFQNTKPLSTFLDPSSRLSLPRSQLKLCIDIAQKFTGARHLTDSRARFQDLSVEGYDLDLRRLSDALRSITGRIVFLYNQKEGKLLFMSPQVKQLFGWSAEKYLQDFSTLFPEGREELDETLRELSLLGHLEVKKTLFTNLGAQVPVSLHLGWIPIGIFKMHVIGIIEEITDSDESADFLDSAAQG